MARKSSKTAHVMNLLAGSESEAQKNETKDNEEGQKTVRENEETVKEIKVLAQQASIQTQAAPSPISIIDMSSSAADPVAELIKMNLEEEESAEQKLSANVEVVLKTEETQPVPESSVPAGTSEENKVIEPPVTDKVPPTYQYLNVMEHVVKSKAEEYINKFGVCSCGHCLSDVTALTLTQLPPKYMVVSPPAAPPLLNFYSSRFSQQVIVELTKACSIVKENPHH